MKKTLAVFFGGRSAEHDISIVTGHQFIENIDQSHYNVVPVYISREGLWYSGDRLLDMSFMRAFDENDPGIWRVHLPPVHGFSALLCEKKKGLFAKKAETISFDIAVLAMHGLNGEDGTLQGVLEMANIPYTSSGVLGSAAGMDKVLMKAAFRGVDIPVLPSLCLLRDEWEFSPDDAITRIESELDYPMFVKPANLGSSIGINKASDRDALYAAVEVAVRYDRRILIEKGVPDLMEYNCSVLGFGADVTASVCEQPVPWQEFLTFEDKYLRDGAGKNSMESLTRVIPAPIDESLSQQIQALSRKIFKLFDCKGVVRIDFIYDKQNEQIYANEINTIPGSFAFYLWEPSGLPFSQLIDKLIDFAVEAQKEKNRNRYAFDSDVLKKANWGAKGKGAKG